MKYSIVLCLVLLAVVSCFADDAVLPEKKTEKRGIYGGFGYGHAPLISHGYGGYGGYHGGHGGYHGGYVGHGYYGGGGHGLYAGYYPGYHGHGFGGHQHFY